MQAVRAPVNVPRLCDPRGHNIAVAIPNLLKVGLPLLGFFAVAISGFLGVSAKIEIFQHPWPIFTFFCALAVGLIVLIFRGKPLRWRGNLGIAVVGMCALVDAAAYYTIRTSPGTVLKLLGQFFGQLGDLLGRLLQGGLIANLVHDPGAYTVLNYLVLAILLFDMAARWMRHFGDKGQASPMPSASDPAGHAARRVDDVQEVLAGDLVVRGLILLALGLLMAFVAPMITSCGVITVITLFPSGCGSVAPPLWLADDILALAALAIGLTLLAVITQNRALAKRQAAVEVAVEVAVVAPGATSLPGWLQMGLDAAEILVGILLAPFRESAIWLVRFARINLRSLLSFVVWAVLMLVGISAGGGLAWVIFHEFMEATATSARPVVWIAGFSTILDTVLWLGVAIGLGAIFVLGVVFALALLAEDRGVVVDALHFLRLIGFMFLALFSVFSFALTAVSALLFLSEGCGSPNATCGPSDFTFPIGPLTLLSFALLIVLALARRLQVRSPTTNRSGGV